MVATIDLIRHPDVDVGVAQWLDLICRGLTPGATIELALGTNVQGSTVVDGAGEVNLVGDPDLSGTGIPVTPGGMRNNLTEFGRRYVEFVDDPGPPGATPIVLMTGQFGGAGIWTIQYAAV